VGATYNYTITTSGGGGPVTGSETVSPSTHSVSGVDVSTLPDGTLTVSVTTPANATYSPQEAFRTIYLAISRKTTTSNTESPLQEMAKIAKRAYL